jgi:hypothetical protein
MTDYIFFIILCLILLLLLINLKKNKIVYSNENFEDVNTPNYHTYILTDDNQIKYELVTFTQLSFNLQKKILDKLTNDEIFKNDTTEDFQNTSSTTNTQLEINNNFNNTFSSPDLNISGNNNYSMPSYSSQPNNLYKKLYSTRQLKSLISDGSNYSTVNDIVFAVRLNRMKDNTVISFKQELLFDDKNDIFYSYNYNLEIKKTDHILSLYKDILTASLPDDSFNIKNKNEFKKAVINDNKISFKNIKLTQIDDSPVYLIDLTDKDHNIKIEKNEVII